MIDVSFKALNDKLERDYLNQLPTSFALSNEAVNRLRAAAATIIRESPDFQQVLEDEGARIVDRPVTGMTLPRCPHRPAQGARGEIAKHTRRSLIAYQRTGFDSCARKARLR